MSRADRLLRLTDLLRAHSASVELRAGLGRPPADLLQLFEEGFSAGLALAFAYQDRAGNRSTRRAEPHGLLIEPPVWYILARDIDRGGPRMFRMDRVTRPRLLRDVTFRPELSTLHPRLAGSRRWRRLLGDGSGLRG